MKLTDLLKVLTAISEAIGGDVDVRLRIIETVGSDDFCSDRFHVASNGTAVELVVGIDA